VKNKNSSCINDDIKGNDSITQSLNLAKKRRTTIEKSNFYNELKDGYRLFDLLNKVPDIEEKLWFHNTNSATVYHTFKNELFVLPQTVAFYVVNHSSSVRSQICSILSILMRDLMDKMATFLLCKFTRANHHSTKQF
jgi:hypothetical protein